MNFSTNVSPTVWLNSRTSPGDLILTGCSGTIGHLIQKATKSRFSHAALVTGANELVEAYEFGLTPNEQDEGIYQTDFSTLVQRTESLQHIAIRRPVGLDRSRFHEVIEKYVALNPAFASIGLCLIGLARASNTRVDATRLAQGLSSELLLDLIRFQSILIGDGPHRVHCSELATRVYIESGLRPTFDAPTLAPLLASVANPAGTDDTKTLSFDGNVRVNQGDTATPRSSVPGKWTGWQDVFDAIGAFRTRLHEQEPPDMADFIVPGDYERAMPFDDIGTLNLIDGVWHEENAP